MCLSILDLTNCVLIILRDFWLVQFQRQILCLPVTLAVLFAISLLIFHHAPHDKSTRNSPHVLPKVVQVLQDQRLARKQAEQDHILLTEDQEFDDTLNDEN